MSKKRTSPGSGRKPSGDCSRQDYYHQYYLDNKKKLNKRSKEYSKNMTKERKKAANKAYRDKQKFLKGVDIGYVPKGLTLADFGSASGSAGFTAKLP